MNNYDDVMGQMRVEGLRPNELLVDGLVHRCLVDGSKERKGWYLLHEWRDHSGVDHIVGSFGIWQGNNKNAIKVELDKKLVMDDAERAAMKLRMAEDRKRAQAQRDAQAQRAARRAARMWAKVPRTMPAAMVQQQAAAALRHAAGAAADVGATGADSTAARVAGGSGAARPIDYLVRKGVQSYGLRYTSTGGLVIPMADGRGEVKGLQFILPADHPRVKATGRDKEYWPHGMSKTGHWFQIGMPHAGAVCLVAEGYATAATLHAATGLAVAVAFDAGNLMPVAQALQKSHKPKHILVCADDDYLQKCHECKKPTPVAVPVCGHCGKEHGQSNPGAQAASAAALAVAGAWLAPVFPADRAGAKLTDFNDLQQFPQGGLALVRAQVEGKLLDLGWLAAGAARSTTTQGGGDCAADDGAVNMVARISVDEASTRYTGTYGMGGRALFDNVARRLVHKDDVLNLLPSHGWDNLKQHPDWRVVYDHQIGFDPTNIDPAIKCNLWDGWAVLDPAAQAVIDPLTRQVLRYDNNTGSCVMLLDLLYNMCGNEANQDEVYQWVLRWLAYPLQHPGAKMQSAIVVHGPQGTGKSRFFEAYGKIFGKHARVLGQEALEDKFNADWAEARQFILADEVMARADMYHIKNRLKGMITSETIRVNPKNVAAHNERNCMNIVFLSNERMPLVLEEDDRRHCVIWVPPKPDDGFFAALNEEIDNGGVVALHDHLLRLDLGDFKPWTKPPMTGSKRDLIQQSLSSEDRFITAWLAGDVEGHGGEALPFCPCLGSHLYQAYEHWCSSIGERSRRAQELIGLAAKRQGWHAGKTQHTWTSLVDPKDKVRKMVVPSDADMAAALKKTPGKEQAALMPDKFDTKAQWMTAGVFAFESALGSKNRGDYA